MDYQVPLLVKVGWWDFTTDSKYQHNKENIKSKASTYS